MHQTLISFTTQISDQMVVWIVNLTIYYALCKGVQYIACQVSAASLHKYFYIILDHSFTFFGFSFNNAYKDGFEIPHNECLARYIDVWYWRCRYEITWEEFSIN